MTPQEAIMNVKAYLPDTDAKKYVIEALEKQIPKKPIFEADGYYYDELVYDTWHCPNCDCIYEVDCEDYDHCPNCGQEIDWGEDDGL